MPSYKKVKIVFTNKTAYVHIPKGWLDYQKRTGRLEKRTDGEGKTSYFLDMVIDKDIVIKSSGRSDISLSQ